MKKITDRNKLRHIILTALLFIHPLQALMAEQSQIIIDDRSTGNLQATSGNEWRLVTDGVMGGVSTGRITTDSIDGRQCLRLQGEVKLDNNGGFVQAALGLSEDILKNITAYKGLMIDVYGNDEEYNIHLRTSDNWLPWQSYRSTLIAPSIWKTLYFPFDEFKTYRIRKALNTEKLKRIGLVAIGREFSADLCIGNIALFR